MTLSLVQLADLQRVRIDLSDYPDGVVSVERSINELLWLPVRGGFALPVDGGTAQLDDYEWPDSTLTHYRVLSVDPPAGLLLDGAAGNYASTPDTAVLDIAGDLDVRVHARLDDWTAAGSQALAAKYTRGGNQRSWLLAVLPSGAPQLIWSANGTAFTTDSSTIPLTPDPVTGELAVRVNVNVDAGGGNRQVTFRTAPNMDGPWALHEQLTVAGVAALFNSSAPLTVGADEGGTLNLATGAIIAVEVRNGIDGTVVATPDFAAQPHGTTGFADAAGRTWTVNGTAEIVGALLDQDSITPSLDGRVWLKSIRHPFLNRPVTVLDRDETVGRESRTGVFQVRGRSTPIAVHDLRASQTFEMVIRTESLEQTRDLDLILASGDVFFIHVPAGSPVPGGYVTIGAAAQQRHYPGSKRFTLPCTVVTPPGPDVVGGTMTYGALLNLYGSFEATLAANPEYADLLLLMASPDDLVVV